MEKSDAMRKYLYVLLVVIVITISGCATSKKAETTDNSKENIQSLENNAKKEKKDNKQEKKVESKEIVSEKDSTPEPVKEVWIPITDPENAPEDWKNHQDPPYCLGCGKTREEIYISRYGYCDECFKLYMEPKLPHCDTCGGVLEGAGYVGTRHTECYHCDYCGGKWNPNYDDHYDPSFGYVCCECYMEQIVGCSQCGYKGDMSMWESGMCDTCLQKWEQNESQVYCSYCGQPTTSPDPQYGLCPNCQQMKEEIENYPW